MQCYESQALRLQLYANTHRLLPETAFDPLVLDEVLDEFNVQRIVDYNALSPARREELIKRVGQLAPRKPTFRTSCVA